MAGKRIVVLSVLLVAALATYAFASDGSPPTVSILNPAHGISNAPTAISNSAAAGASFMAQVQVWDDVAIIGGSVDVGWLAGASDPDIGAWTWVEATLNPNYVCGDDCGVYDVAMTLTPGNDYWLRARATSAEGTGYSSDARTGNEAKYSYIRLRTPKSGTGMLLARDKSNRMCMDCHGQILSHSSQTTDASSGNWQNACLTCHTPHSTTNIFLIKQSIMTPNSAARAVKFWNATTLYNGSGAYVDGGAGGATKGICQVCHTQTTRWRNTGPGDGHFATQDCVGCHSHGSGFAGTGGACNTCHGYPPISGDTKNEVGTIDDGGKGVHWYLAIDGAHINNSVLDVDNDAWPDTGGECVKCHDGGSHDGVLTVSIIVANSFDGGAPTYQGVQGENSTPKTCSNVNCHFGQETPRWSCPGEE